MVMNRLGRLWFLGGVVAAAAGLIAATGLLIAGVFVVKILPVSIFALGFCAWRLSAPDERRTAGRGRSRGFVPTWIRLFGRSRGATMARVEGRPAGRDRGPRSSRSQPSGACDGSSSSRRGRDLDLTTRNLRPATP